MHDAKYLLQNNEVLEQSSRIHLLRLITLIVKNLKKEDCPEFEAILSRKDSGALLAFALKKIPLFEVKLLEDINSTNQKLREVARTYANT